MDDRPMLLDSARLRLFDIVGKVESFKNKENGIYHCRYCNHGNLCCAAVMPGRLPYICSRERNHEGPHIACGPDKNDHPIASWPNEEETS